MSGRQKAFTAAKIIFAAAAIWFLFHKIDPATVWMNVSHANPATVILGILLCLSTVGIAGWRWKRLLALFGIQVPLASLVCIAQIGQFFTMFMPGPVGDDLTRMLYISRIAKGRVGEACTSVLMDRLIGLSSTLLVAVFCIPWQSNLLAVSGKTKWMSVGIMAAGGVILVCGILFFLLNAVFLQGLIEKLLRFLPASNIRNELSRINGRIFTNRKSIAGVIGAAVGTQLILCAVFYLAGRSVGIDASFATWLVFVPIVLAANAVPITVAGLGVREYLMVQFLAALAHVEPAQAFAASLIVLAMTLAVCLLGGVMYVFYRPKKRLPIPAQRLPKLLEPLE